MRKLVYCFIAFMMLFIVGCGGGKDKPSEVGAHKSHNHGVFDPTTDKSEGDFTFQGSGNDIYGTYTSPLDFDLATVLLTTQITDGHHYAGDSNFVALYAYNEDTKDTTKLLFKKFFNMQGTINNSDLLRLSQKPDKIEIKFIQFVGAITVNLSKVKEQNFE